MFGQPKPVAAAAASLLASGRRRGGETVAEKLGMAGPFVGSPVVDCEYGDRWLRPRCCFGRRPSQGSGTSRQGWRDQHSSAFIAMSLASSSDTCPPGALVGGRNNLSVLGPLVDNVGQRQGHWERRAHVHTREPSQRCRRNHTSTRTHARLHAWAQSARGNWCKTPQTLDA